MQVYTQIVRPQELDEDDLWIPCLTTATVKHSPAEQQPLIITHIEAINHYEHSLDKLLEQKVWGTTVLHMLAFQLLLLVHFLKVAYSFLRRKEG